MRLRSICILLICWRRRGFEACLSGGLDLALMYLVFALGYVEVILDEGAIFFQHGADRQILCCGIHERSEIS